MPRGFCPCVRLVFCEMNENQSIRLLSACPMLLIWSQILHVHQHIDGLYICGQCKKVCYWYVGFEVCFNTASSCFIYILYIVIYVHDNNGIVHNV